MHLLLTDLLTCPRCGPAFGLILLANVLAERRVLDGVLGCANCREQYRIRDGGGELGGSAALPAQSEDEEIALKVAALLGVAQGPGFVLVVGPWSAHARALARLLPDVEVIASPYDAAPHEVTGDVPGVSRLGTAGRTLPLASGKLPGVALSGTAADRLLEEGARAISPVGRLVLEPAPADAAERLAAAGLRVLAHEGGTLVAARV